MAARAGFEPTTLRPKGFDSTNAPQRPSGYGESSESLSNVVSGQRQVLVDEIRLFNALSII